MFYSLLARDIIEIAFYSSVVYALCTWLKADKTKNIIAYFFAYCAFAIAAWVVQLPTLSPFLFSYAPIALLLFIVLHEKTLQRNLISLCAITPARAEQEDWLDTLLSSSLTIINANKKITVVIEHKDALEYFLTTPFFINADMGKNMLDILFTSALYDEQKMVWINTSGKIRSINNTWQTTQEKKEDALFYTQQSDAIILNAHPVSRMFTLIIKGKEIKDLSAHQVRVMIKKQLSLPTVASQRKGAYREANATEKSLSL